MFASLQTLQRPNGMGPHGLLGLGSIPVNQGDWQLGYCTNDAGESVVCDYSRTYSESWNDAECDPQKSHAAGQCVDSDGTPQPNVSPMAALNSLASGAALTAPTHSVVNVIGAGTENQKIVLTPNAGNCAQSLMSGVCDSTLYIGLAAFAGLLVLMKVGR